MTLDLIKSGSLVVREPTYDVDISEYDMFYLQNAIELGLR
jgi:hypothetical protein